MDEEQLRCVAREGMRVAFQHLASRVMFALDRPEVQGINSLVVSGGVACNKYLKHVLQYSLDQNGYHKMTLVFPPPEYCTDNAAMIAWTGIEMYEAGWRTSLEAMATNKWAIDPKASDGGILGLDGWINKEENS
jgi:N6-L-threonylcarbamoyladenine synthase